MGKRTDVRYLVSGTNEYGDFNVGCGTAAVVLKKARKLLQEGYVNVRREELNRWVARGDRCRAT
jgi:hypothetical protein